MIKKKIKVLVIVVIFSMSGTLYADDSCWKEVLTGAGVAFTVEKANQLGEVVNKFLSIDIEDLRDIDVTEIEFCKRYTSEEIGSVQDLLPYADDYIFVCRTYSERGLGPETRKLTGNEAIRGIFSGDFYLIDGILLTRYLTDTSFIIEKLRQIKQ